jgi:AcrR family transcriptional regulator
MDARRHSPRSVATVHRNGPVTLQEIADDAGVTSALVNRYFVSERARLELVAARARTGWTWDRTELREHLADGIVDLWKGADARDPALALVRHTCPLMRASRIGLSPI